MYIEPFVVHNLICTYEPLSIHCCSSVEFSFNAAISVKIAITVGSVLASHLKIGLRTSWAGSPVQPKTMPFLATPPERWRQSSVRNTVTSGSKAVDRTQMLMWEPSFTVLSNESRSILTVKDGDFSPQAICTEAGLMALRERRMKVTSEDFRKSKENVLYRKKEGSPEGLYL